MNSETSVSICIKCGAGAPTQRNDKAKLLCLKVCASCEQKDRNSSSVPDIKDQCAACGKSGEDINLKSCNACKMVKYCNRDCQIAHRSKHKKECRQRALEIQNGVDNIADNMKKVSISDDKLFQEPPAKEDCSICFQPMPYVDGLCGVKGTYQPCCGKLICSGCMFATVWGKHHGNLKKCCIFCRSKDLSEEEELTRCKERMNAGHAETFYYMGNIMYHEKGDIDKALEMWNLGANLGHAASHHSIADVYLHEYGGKKKDDKKAQYHLEHAAIGGHEMARHSLGINEFNAGNMDRAMKHFMMAARTGYDEPLKLLKDGYSWGIVSKDEYASTLRAHKASQDEMKSNGRIVADRLDQARNSGIDPNDREGMAPILKELIAEGRVGKNGIIN